MRKTIIAAALAAAATPALGQVDVSQGLVDVTIQDVSILNNFLNDAQIAALNGVSVPVTVQVPVGVAANVCGVDANVLASQKKAGDATCNATNGSKALAQQVVKQKLGGQRR
jgi:hypothetical protein